MIVGSLKVLVIFGLVAVLQIAGCGEVAPASSKRTDVAGGLTQCTEPRPEICTREYAPVCALLQEGTRRSYASKCVACSDQNVVAYKAGKCT